MAKFTIAGEGHGLKPEERECLEKMINSRLSRCDNSACKHIDAVHVMYSEGDRVCLIPDCDCVNGSPE